MLRTNGLYATSLESEIRRDLSGRLTNPANLALVFCQFGRALFSASNTVILRAHRACRVYIPTMTSRDLKTRDEAEAELQAFAASRRSAERRLRAAQAAQMAQVRSHAQATARRVDDRVKRVVRPEPARASRPVTAPLARMTPKRDPLMDALERAYLGQAGSPEERAERRRGLATDRIDAERAMHSRRNTQRSYVAYARKALVSCLDHERQDVERLIRVHAASGAHGDEAEILAELGLGPR